MTDAWGQILETGPGDVQFVPRAAISRPAKSEARATHAEPRCASAKTQRTLDALRRERSTATGTTNGRADPDVCSP